MEFFKNFAISPPNDAGHDVVLMPGQKMATLTSKQTLTKALEIWSDEDLVVLPSGLPKPTIDYQRVIAGKVVWADVIPVDRDKPGAKTFALQMETGGNRKALKTLGLVPIYYLPWSSGKLIEIRLPDVGADMDNTAEHPRLFFTAALSGCSIFVDGDPARPRIVHAGINGALKEDAATFWRSMLKNVSRNTGIPIDDHLREVNKNQYMATVWAKGFKNFLQADHKSTLDITDVKEWASVFGIRFGRLWSFYLQRNVTATTYRLVKKKDTHIFKPNANTSIRVLKSSGLDVVEKDNGFFSKSVYVVKEEVAMPMTIEEFYPTGNARITPYRHTIIR